MTDMEEIESRAFAKINLGLDVTGTREDGYHTVRMVMQNVRIFDRITIRKKETTGFSMSSDAAYLPTDENNLMVKAASLMFEAFKLSGGLSMKLQKYIPVAAGMGGGSSDAAAVLHGINRLFELHLPVEKLQEIGLKIGADVPFCLLRSTALAEGIGEILTPLPACPACKVVVAKPPISVSTKLVYQKLILDENTVHPDIDGMVRAIRSGDLRGVTDRMGNVLESVTAVSYPVIGRIRDSLLSSGALNAMMSGSGPTVFGIFDDEETAGCAADRLRSEGDARTIRVVDMMR